MIYSAATSLQVTDRYDPNSFDVMGDEGADDGSVLFELDTLESGSSHRFNVTVVPKLSGLYDSTRARFKYFSEDPEDENAEPDERQGSSSSMGKIKIISKAEYESSISYNVKEWSVCAVLVFLSVLVPLFNMKSANAKAASLQKSK